MASQPDFEKIAEGLTTLAQEISRVPNVPSIDNGRALLESIDALKQLMQNQQEHTNQQFGTLRTEMSTLRTDVGTLRTDVGILRTDVGTLRTDMISRFQSLELRMSAE